MDTMGASFAAWVGVLVALILIIVAAVAAGRRKPKNEAAGFCGSGNCAVFAWGGGSDRENFAAAADEGYSRRKRERRAVEAASPHESFSPDAPGACGRKFSRAAQAELEALGVAAGL